MNAVATRPPPPPRPLLRPGLLAAALLSVLLGFAAAELGLRALLLAAALPAAVLLLMQPRWAYWSLVACIPVTVEFGPGLTVTRLLLPLVLLSVLGNALLRRCPWPSPLASPSARAGTLFFAATAMAALVALALPAASLDRERLGVEFNASLTRLVIFMLTLSMVRSADDLRAVLRVLVIAGVLEALLVVAQVHLRLTLPGDWRAAAINNIDDSVGAFRAEGTTAHPIYLAGYLQMVLPFAILAGVQARLGGRLLALAGLALLLYAWSAAVSRSSLLGLLAMAGAALCFWSRWGRGLVLALAVLLLLALAAHGWRVTELAQTLEQLRGLGSNLRPDQLTSGAGSLGFRLESSAGGWALFMAHPLTGVGLGQTHHLYGAHLPAWADSPFHPQDIHNVFVGVAADAGVLALAALLALWWLALRGLHAAWHDPQLGTLARTLAVALIGQLVFVCLTPMVRDMWFTLALAAAIGELMRRQTALAPQLTPPQESR